MAPSKNYYYTFRQLDFTIDKVFLNINKIEVEIVVNLYSESRTLKLSSRWTNWTKKTPNKVVGLGSKFTISVRDMFALCWS